MLKFLIIDGYNAISKIREFEAKKDISLEASRLAFIKALVDFRQRNASFDKIIAVFDGKSEGPGIGKESYGNVEAVFSNKARNADEAIVSILKIAPSNNKIIVSSDDNFVKNHSRAFGCGAMSIKELEDLISLKKKAVKGKILEKDLEDNEMQDITRELKKHWGVE